MKDRVTVTDHIEMVRNTHKLIQSVLDKEPVLIRGFFSCVCRERGKIVPGSHRDGFNIWTLTGREYLAQLMSYSAYGSPDTPARNDRIRYIGFGTGTQEEVSFVSKIVTPIPYNSANNYLAELDIPSYPLTPSRTTVQYTRTFAEDEISIGGIGTVILKEAGLFSDGDPGSGWSPGTRDPGDDSGAYPMAYKTFEPFRKTQNFILDVTWQIRF